MPITLRIAMQIRYLVICLVTAYPLLVACSNDDGSNADDGSDVVPIAFSSFSAEEPEVTTRAVTSLKKDFLVYGLKKAETYCQTVFNGYKVAYTATAGNTPDYNKGYYYVGAAPNQTVKYWDYAAQQYQFFAFCPTQTVTGTTIDATNIMAATLNIPTAADIDNLPLYTNIKTVEKENYGEEVQMEFLHPVAQVRYRFIISDGIDDKASVKIENSTFAPYNSGEKIYTGGNVTVTHSTKGTTVHTADTQDANATTIAAFTNPGTDYTTVLPVGNTPYGPFVLHALVSGVQKTAVVPQEYMQWQPNHKYTYVFSIVDNNMTIVFVDMVEDDWLYGGYTQDEQRQW